jgi:hypothetical protein
MFNRERAATGNGARTEAAGHQVTAGQIVGFATLEEYRRLITERKGSLQHIPGSDL